MSLFSSIPPCPICGCKISWLLPQKIEGQYICDTCYNKIDMQPDKVIHLTMQGFKEYLVFYEQNQLLKRRFVISQRIDLGLGKSTIIFDYLNKLFCISNNPTKTVFEGKHLKYFTIKEDTSPLFEGSTAGIRHYASNVPERAMDMTQQTAQLMMSKQTALDKLDDTKEKGTTPRQYFAVPEPFQTFNLELHIDHPYWTVKKFNIDGPRFGSNFPDVNDYIRSYQRSIEELEKLVAAFKTVAFPEAPEQSVELAATQAIPYPSLTKNKTKRL